MFNDYYYYCMYEYNNYCIISLNANSLFFICFRILLCTTWTIPFSFRFSSDSMAFTVKPLNWAGFTVTKNHQIKTWLDTTAPIFFIILIIIIVSNATEFIMQETMPSSSAIDCLVQHLPTITGKILYMKKCLMVSECIFENWVSLGSIQRSLHSLSIQQSQHRAIDIH